MELLTDGLQIRTFPRTTLADDHYVVMHDDEKVDTNFARAPAKQWDLLRCRLLVDGPGVDFELFKPPAMKVFPLIGFDGGSIIHVTGFDLHVPSLCHFGPQTSKAHLVSSALSICTSPSVFVTTMDDHQSSHRSIWIRTTTSYLGASCVIHVHGLLQNAISQLFSHRLKGGRH